MIDPGALGTLLIRQNAERVHADGTPARGWEPRSRTRTRLRAAAAAAAARGLRALAARLDGTEPGAASGEEPRTSRPVFAITWLDG